MVSIVIPIYNSEQYLFKCLDSVLSQTYSDLEIILINDGSTDGSRRICEMYHQNDNRVRVINQSNSGVSRARNRGVEEANGEYIFFVDADDWIEKNCIETLLSAMNKDVDISCCGCYIETAIDSYRRDYFPDAILPAEQALDTMSPYFWSVIWGKLIRRSLCDTYNKLFDEDIYYSEDTLAYCKLLKCAKNVFWTSTPYYHYWTNPTGAMKSPDPNRLYTEFIARGRIADLLSNNHARYEDAVVWQVDAALKVYKFYLDIDFNSVYQKELRMFLKEYKNLYLASNYRGFDEKNWLIKLLRYYLIYKATGKIRMLWMRWV